MYLYLLVLNSGEFTYTLHVVGTEVDPGEVTIERFYNRPWEMGINYYIPILGIEKFGL